MTQKVQFVMDHHKEYSAAELADGLDMPLATVYKLGKDFGLKFKRVYRKGIGQQRAGLAGRPDRLSFLPWHQVPKSLQPDPPPKPLERPPAKYDNQNSYLATLEKYGI